VVLKFHNQILLIMEIIKEPAFKTWDLGKLPGTKQDEKTQGILDNQLINRPNEQAGNTGESFHEFSTRVLTAIRKVVEEAPANTVVLTHNSVFGLIKLWNIKGRPKYLDKPFRTEYTKQGSDTGDYFVIKGANGDIYICRHGETVDNVKGNFRQDDVELTDKGKQEAKQLGKDLEDVKISQIVSSPLPRAIETFEAILKAQKKENEKGSEDTEDEEDMTDQDDKKEGTKEETPEQEVAEFIDCILVGAAIVHKMHLRETGPGSYAAHKALNELYDALPDHADDLAEAYQGYAGKLLPNVGEVDQMEYLKMGHVEYVEYLIKYVDDYRKCFGEVSALQNKVDELQGTLYSARYKLKFLS